MNKTLKIALLLLLPLMLTGCFSYSFQGGSIPKDVNTIFIAYFSDETGSGRAQLSDQLFRALEDRFVNQSRLQLADTEGEADVVLRGTLRSYSNRPFAITSDELSNENRVNIEVSASYQYTSEPSPEWSRSFSGFANYDPAENPIQGERDATEEALEKLALDMFNESVARW